jgi:hypothetical protein
VTYKEVDSDWQLDLFAAYNPTNYNKLSAVIIAYITLKAHLNFILRKLVFLQISWLPWPMPEVLTSTDFSFFFLHLEISLSRNS